MKKRKRDVDDQGTSESKADSTISTNIASPMQAAFLQYSAALEQRYDTEERIFKKSRDITKASKRAISHLHRITNTAEPQKLLEEVEKMLKITIPRDFRDIRLLLDGLTYYSCWKKYSPAIQEYIEALSFYRYLLDGELVSKDEVEKYLNEDFQKLSDEKVESGSSYASGGLSPTEGKLQTDSLESQRFIVREEDYILGLSDLTGELMRYALNALSDGHRSVPPKVCEFARTMLIAMNLLDRRGLGSQEMAKKLKVMQESVEKIETVCYKIHMMESEYSGDDLDMMFKMKSKSLLSSDGSSNDLD